jgi:hypothetical protein
VRGLVAVFPVKTGGSAAGTDGDGVDHEEELRRLLTDLPSGGDSPFGRIAGVHFARLALLDRRCIGVHPRRRDCIQPRCSYLLLAADFDAGAIQPGAGSPDETYLRAMYETMADEVDAAFSHCWGYEPSSGGDGFVRLALRCRRPFLREFIDCPDQSLGSVLAALEGHGRLLDLIRRRDADGTVDAAALYALADSG